MEKPRAMIATSESVPFLFLTMKRYFDIDKIVFDLESLDRVSHEQLSSPREIAAVAMRKLQLFYIISSAGTTTSTDIVLGLCAELVRALEQLAHQVKNNAPEVADAMIQGSLAFQSCGFAVGSMGLDNPGGELT
jgi:hypothetical protein